MVTPGSATYVPGQPMQVTLSNTNGTQFKGFNVQAVQGNPGTANQAVIGSFSALTGEMKFNSNGCAGTNGVVTHSSNALKGTQTFTWTPPADASGPITFHAVGVVSRLEWYGQTTKITATVMPASSSDAGATGGGSSATGGGSATKTGCTSTGFEPGSLALMAVLFLLSRRSRGVS